MCRPLPASMLITIVVLATVANTRAQDVVFPTERSGECTARGGGRGRCLDIRYCPAHRSTALETLSLGCGFSRFYPKVCCPISQEVSSRLKEDISPPIVNFECGVNAKNTVVLRQWYSGPVQILRPGAENQDPEEANITGLELRGRPGIPEEALDALEESLREQADLGPGLQPAVGGVAARKNAWPWMALIGEYITPDDINWFCGGVLINDQWVLSALHCFLQKKPEVVRLGEHDYNDDRDGAEHEDLGVSEILWFPEYTHPHAYHDLALLRLNDTVTLKTYVSPVCLPWGEERRQELTGQEVTLAGWGDTLFGGYPSSVLQEVNLTVFPSSRCDEKYASLLVYKDNWPRGINQETICAGHPDGGKDACRGDSGGPIVRVNSVGRYTLAGIVSKGHGCGLKDYPGLYVNINQPAYLKWIKSVAF